MGVGQRTSLIILPEASIKQKNKHFSP